jgi:Fe-Mn family superoxide dismutase
MAFTLPQLPYAYDALEPHYDKQTLEIHHGKHHNAYTQKLNAAAEAAGISGKSIEEILTSLDTIPADKRGPVLNHGGGYYNHTFFWESMAPNAVLVHRMHKAIAVM